MERSELISIIKEAESVVNEAIPKLGTATDRIVLRGLAFCLALGVIYQDRDPQ